jgi:hypothetical protein
VFITPPTGDSQPRGLVRFENHVRSPPMDTASRQLLVQLRRLVESSAEYKADLVNHAEYCTDTTLYRYLRARGRDVMKAKIMITEALVWRTQMKPQLIRSNQVEFEALTGKTRIGGLDRWGRPVYILFSSALYLQSVLFLHLWYRYL